MAKTGSLGVIETSLGRAVAVAVLAPIADRLAQESVREAAKEEERRQLEEELAALPSLERPAAPGVWIPWWSSRRELKEVLLGLLIVGVPAVAFGGAAVGLIFSLVFGSEVVGLVFSILGGLALIFAWVKREVLDELKKGRELDEARDRYARQVKEFDAREAQISRLRSKLEEIAR